MGGAGDSPAPVGDPPTGTAPSHLAKRPFSLPRIVVSVPSGGSPDGPGGSPVLPGNHFPNTLLLLCCLSTPFHKYDHVCCVDFRFGEARRGSIPRSGAVTEEQRSQNRKATQPSGRRFFLAQTSLLTPYRPRKGMRVARASSGPKIPRRKRGRIYEMGY